MPESGRANHNIDGGLTYLLNNNLMLDISGGKAISRHAETYYVALGFSFRFK